MLTFPGRGERALPRWVVALLGLFLALLAASLVSGCATNKRGGPIPYDVQDFGAPDAPRVIETTDAMRIGPGDTLTVAVFNVPDLAREVTVAGSGSFDFPLIGQVDAAGMTAKELEKTLEARLGAKYLQSPDVDVVIKNSYGQRVTVDGAVTRPGVYPLPRETTLMQAVALANGTTEDANLRRVVVFRTIDGKRMAAAFDLVDIRRGLAADPEIYGRDVVIVDGSSVRRNMRDILSTVPLLTFFTFF